MQVPSSALSLLSGTCTQHWALFLVWANGCVDWSSRLFYWKNAIYLTPLSHTRESSVGRVPEWPSGPRLCRASRGPCAAELAVSGVWRSGQAQKQRWADRAVRLELTEEHTSDEACTHWPDRPGMEGKNIRKAVPENPAPQSEQIAAVKIILKLFNHFLKLKFSSFVNV